MPKNLMSLFEQGSKRSSHLVNSELYMWSRMKIRVGWFLIQSAPKVFDRLSGRIVKECV